MHKQLNSISNNKFAALRFYSYHTLLLITVYGNNHKKTKMHQRTNHSSVGYSEVYKEESMQEKYTTAEYESGSQSTTDIISKVYTEYGSQIIHTIHASLSELGRQHSKQTMHTLYSLHLVRCQVER